MVLRWPGLSHRGLELERLKNHAGSIDTPRGVKPALAVIVEFAVVENILGGDGDGGWNDFISVSPWAGWTGMFSMRPRNSNSSGLSGVFVK